MFGLFMKKMLGNNEYRNWMIEVSIQGEAHCDFSDKNTSYARTCDSPLQQFMNIVPTLRIKSDHLK